VVDPGTVIATHLNHLVTQHAAELLGRQERRRCSTIWAKAPPNW